MKRGDSRLHVLDKFIGVPLVFILGSLKKKNKKIPTHVGRIAFLEGNAIGDTVLLLAVINDLKDRYPSCELVFFSGTTNYEIAKLSTKIDHLVKLPLNNPLEAIKLIRAQGTFDVFVDFMSWPRISSVFTLFAKAKLKIGFQTKNQYRHYGYDIKVPHSDQIHEIQNFNALLTPLGVSAKSLSGIDIGNIKSNRLSVILHMFPSGYKSALKKWPDKNWKALAWHFLDQGYEVSITGGPSDRDEGHAFASDFLLNKNFTNHAGNLSLADTIHLLKRAQLVISVNTGIMHIASALNINLIALHGPTSVLRWGPLNQNSISIQSSHADAPCLNLGFEYNCGNVNCNCMELIELNEIKTKASLFLDDLNIGNS